jgi:hypothetical protein
MRLRYRQQKGLTLTFAAASMIAIVGVAALVIDGGRMYIVREVLQYQCEAAALAGAMELPLPQNEPARTYAVTAATNQAKRCASGMGLNLNNSDISFPTDQRIRVIHNRSTRHLFAGVLGFFSPKIIGAAAAVNVGGTRVLSGGAFPVGISDETVNNVTPGTIIKIWDEDKITDDAGNIVSGGSRGWLNFNFVYTSTDADGRAVKKTHTNSDLKDWVNDGYDKPLYAGSLGGLDSDFINGDSGTRSSTIQEADSRVGSIVWLPVYDNVYSDSFMASNLSPSPSIGWGNDNYYHVIGFAAFEITDVKHSSSNKYVAGRFVRQQIGGSYGTTTTGGGTLGGSAIVE